MDKMLSKKIRENKAVIEKLNISKLGETPGERRVWKSLWKKLLIRWGEVMNEFIQAVNKKGKPDARDLPYWHGEDASTGFLAAAAWRMGGVAVEQFYLERKKKSKKGTSKGHGDLRVKFGRRGNFSFIAEAKMRWDYEPEKLRGSIEVGLKNAKKQLRRIIERYKKNFHQITVCYISPRVPKKKEGKFVKEKFVKTVRDLYRQKQNVIVASHFPPSARKIQSSEVEYKKRKKFIYPGIVLIAKIVK